MKICLVVGTDLNSTETRIMHQLVPHLEKLGAKVLINQCYEDFDFIIGGTVGVAGRINEIHKRFPKIKMINYIWDLYPWVVESAMYDFQTYADLLQKSIEIWCPSKEVALRVEEFYKLGHKCQIIKSYAEFFEDEKNIKANNYFVYHPVRSYRDPNEKMIDKACEELGYELFRAGNSHKLTYEGYKEKVLTCSFLVTEYNEASTGGLTLLEGYYHGKDVLLSDSIYQGGKDYFGDRAYYFKDGDAEDLKDKVKMLWERSQTYKITEEELEERRQYCSQFFIEMMANNMMQQLKFLHGANILY